MSPIFSQLIEASPMPSPTSAHQPPPPLPTPCIVAILREYHTSITQLRTRLDSEHREVKNLEKRIQEATLRVEKEVDFQKVQQESLDVMARLVASLKADVDECGPTLQDGGLPVDEQDELRPFNPQIRPQSLPLSSPKVPESESPSSPDYDVLEANPEADLVEAVCLCDDCQNFITTT
jgi:hypothetical protein